MKDDRFIVRCYTMKKDEAYFAACLTLNLTAVGKTMEEAKRELEDVINLYLEVAVNNQPLEEAKRLLRRPAPLYMYVEFSMCFIISKIFAKSKNEKVFTQIPDLQMCMAH